MENLGCKFYSNDPEIGEISDPSKADFAIDRVMMTMDEFREKYPDFHF